MEATAVEVDESLDVPLASRPESLASVLAADKALAAREALGRSPEILLGFDTIVALDGRLLGKPVDNEDARSMLRALSGRSHEVMTGVAVLRASAERPRTFAVTTRVVMRELDAEAIEAWVAEGELLGCAGAYNIERHLASVSDDECFQNVAGLPLCHLYRELADVGAVVGLSAPVSICDEALGRHCTLGPEVCGEA